MVTRRSLALSAAVGLTIAGAGDSAARQPRNPPLGVLEEMLEPAPSRTASRRTVARAALVPLPRPRPAEAPARPVALPDRPEKPEAPAEAAAPTPREPAPPSACRVALTEAVAIAPSIPDVTGPGGCGGEDLVKLEAIVLPGGSRVALKPAATMRCEMATTVAAWMREDIVPLADGMSAKPVALDNFDSFDCRGRNRVVGAKLSEHGKANALDLRAIELSNGTTLALTDRATPREMRERVLHSVCARFSTVLGPGSDGYHEDHIHLDLAARRSGYRICQWQVDDAMPEVAPLMPAPRPEEAPPREEAAKAAPAKE